MHYIHRYTNKNGVIQQDRYVDYDKALSNFKRINRIIDLMEYIADDYTMTNLLIEGGSRYGNNKEGTTK